MRFRSKLMLGLLVFSTLPLVLLGWFVSRQVDETRHGAVAQIQIAAQETVEEVRSLTRRAARLKAERLAQSLAEFFRRHPGADVSQLAGLDAVRRAAEANRTLDSETRLELVLDEKPIPLAELVDTSAAPPAAARRGYSYVADVPGSRLKVAAIVDDTGLKKPVDELASIMRTIAANTERTTNEQMDNLRTMLGIGVAATVVALTLVAGLLARNVTRPVAKLTAAAQRISRGEREVDLHVEGGREVELLAAAFERATTELRDYASSLEAKNRELEVARNLATEASQELQQALDEIVKVDKMSSLGRLVAGMADDSGTAAAVIDSVTPEAAESLDVLVAGLRRLHEMAPEEFATFRRFLDLAAARHFMPARVSPDDTRELVAALGDGGIAEPKRYAELLARCHLGSVEEGVELCALLDRYDVADAFAALVEIHASSQINRTSADKISRIAQALRFYSRGGGGIARSATTDVNRSIRDALVILHNRLTAQAEVQLDLAEELPEATFGGGNLVEACSGLLGQACESIEAKGEHFHGSIRIQTSGTDGAVRIVISDNGAELAPDVVEQIQSPLGAQDRGPASDFVSALNAIKRSGGAVSWSLRGGYQSVEVLLPVEQAAMEAAG
jgi:signal transduction histidine kinase